MMQKLTRSTRRAFLVTAVALVALATVPGSASAATSPLPMEIQMYDSCIAGNATDNSTLSFVWRTAGGALKASGSTLTDPSFGWEYCATDPGVWVEPGDRISLDDGTNARNYVVPNLTMAINRVTDKVTGTGPVGRSLRVCPHGRFADFERCHGVRAAQDGTWSYKDSGDLDGFQVDVRWISPNDDSLQISAYAPFVAPMLGTPKFSGSTGVPRGIAHAELNSGAKAAGFAVGDQYGNFSGTFLHEGNPVNVAVGDVVSSDVASNAQFVMPNVEGSADRHNETVSGRCFDSGTSAHFVDVTITHSGRVRGFGTENVEPDDTFTIDFKHTPPFGGYHNIRPDDRITVACGQTTSDYAQLKFRVP
jgi:hypothetical protein